ncbi:hypothetical protein N752_23210 [Desulforamulus aquiferis]|nr:class II fructose-bisphosphate aldolase [Desulforamulus aquiferis]RYD02691.1 hypothetical protein N752_23210 [Desulforamulus aquiferis]
MALANLSRLLKDAMVHGYAIGSYNMVDINSLEAIINGAVRLNSPIIVSVSENHFPYVDIEKMSSVIGYLANNASIPVGLHLDNGQSIAAIMKAIRRGFTSVMFDGSRLPLAENMARTAEIVRFAHAAGVAVEGHIGKISEVGNENLEQTDPSKAAMFVQATGIDALALDFQASGSVIFPKINIT